MSESSPSNEATAAARRRHHLGIAEQGKLYALAGDHKLAPAKTLVGWLDRNLHSDATRIVAEQRRHGCFSVRRDTVDPSRAVTITLPQPGL